MGDAGASATQEGERKKKKTLKKCASLKVPIQVKGNETQKKSVRIISESLSFAWASTETEAPSSSSLRSYM